MHRLDRRAPALVLEPNLTTALSASVEVFCNFPGFSQFHKARIVNELLGPMIVGASFDAPRR